MRDFRLTPAAGGAWLAAALAVGMDTASRWWTATGLVAAALLVAAGVARVARVRRPVGGGRSAGGILATGVLAAGVVVVVVASCSVQLGSAERGLLPRLVADRAVVTAQGVVRAEAQPLGDDRFRSVIAVRHLVGRGMAGDASAELLLIGGAEVAELPYGAEASVVGRLGPTDPGDELRGTLVADRIEVARAPRGVDRAVAEIRSGLLRVSDTLSGDARVLLPGTAIGDTSRMPADLERAMRDVSLTHVTAVSGAHFAVLSVSVLALTGLLRLPRWGRAVAVGAVMTGFVLLVHPQPSVVRAAAMGAVALLGILLGRPARAVPALGAAVVGLLVLDPWLARSYGFVLSVLATGGIALLAPPIARRLRVVLPGWLALAIAVPVAAQAVCAPVLVLLDPGVSLYAVPANLAVAPALLPATVLGVLAAVLAPWFPAGATAAVQGAGLANWWIAAVARFMAGLPGARLGWLPGVAGALALAALTAALLWALWRGRRGRPALVVLCAVVVGLPLIRQPVAALLDPAPRDWRLTVCDVGQGDALAIRGAQGTIVIDVGPSGGGASRCLDRFGVQHVDLLVLTHFHEDHVGGLAEVLRGRRVDRALVSPLRQPVAEAEAALAELAHAGVPVAVGAVDGLGSGAVGDLRWQVLSPDLAAATGGEQDANDASLVLVVRSPGLTVLAMGDAGDGARRWTLSAEVDVVKVAHHGSADQVAPLPGAGAPLAVVSVGAGNDYGHPAPSALSGYREAGSLVLRTDECGDVAVSVREGGLAVSAACQIARPG